jgi:MFS family permease
MLWVAPTRYSLRPVATSPPSETAAPDSAKEPEARWAEIVTGRYGLYTLSINLGIFMWAINNLVVAGVMPTVVADIGGMRLYSWTFALFSMGSVMGAASAGPLRDIFGGKAAYAGAGSLFCLGLMGAAVAPNMESLIVARFFQGLGGGAVSSLGYSMMATLYPERLRGRILAFTSTAWGVATSLGPGFGGVFAEFGLWREAFWGMTPLCLLFIAMALRIIPDLRDGQRKPSFPFGRLLLLGGAVVALSASSQTDSYGLRAAFIATSIALAATSFFLDGRAPRPMFPRKALRIFTETGALYWIMALNQGTVCIYATFQTLQLQVLHGVPPIVAAYLFMLSSLSWSVVAVLVATWRGKMETLGIILGNTCLLIGTSGLALTVVPGPVWLIAVFIAICGSGIGFMNNMLIQRAIRSVPADEKGIAGSSTQAIRTMGVAFGAALAGLVAVAGGLGGAAPNVETVAPAMQWVYAMDVIVAATSLIIALGMIVATKR